MADDSANEKSISGDAYESLAFKGNSAQYLVQVIDEVTQLSQQGDIYPPAFATWREPILKHGLSTKPNYENDSRLSPAEAVAIRVMADEGSAIAQNLFESTDKTKLINGIIGTPDAWPSDVVDGMAHFGYQLCGAARIRDRIIRGESIPTGKTMRELVDHRLWKRYKAPLQLDGMVIRGNTVTAITEEANSLVEQEIRGVPEGAKDEKELQDRMNSRRRGIEIGAKIYKDVLEVATQRGLRTTVEKTVEIKPAPIPQLTTVKK